jgi:hypothetical protein
MTCLNDKCNNLFELIFPGIKFKKLAKSRSKQQKTNLDYAYQICYDHTENTDHHFIITYPDRLFTATITAAKFYQTALKLIFNTHTKSEK